MNGPIDTGESLLLRLMSASSLRNEVHTHNLANENTPGYRRRVVRFEDELRSALRQPGGDPAGVRPTVVEDRLTPPGPDGNNVTQELELGTMRENQLLYETYAKILRSNFDLLHAGITSF